MNIKKDKALKEKKRVVPKQKTIKKTKKLMNLGLIKDNKKILLAMKKRGFGEGWWNGYGGKLQEGETIEGALVREFKEESGIDVLGHEKKGIITFDFVDKEESPEVHIFEITDYEGEPVESEEMKPGWFEHDKIPFQSMWPDDSHWMPLFLAGKKFVGRFLFDTDGSIIEFDLTETGSL